MTSFDVFKLYYRVRRLHMSPVRAGLIAAWSCIKPKLF